jgi:hypothetical protein
MGDVIFFCVKGRGRCLKSDGKEIINIWRKVRRVYKNVVPLQKEQNLYGEK